MTANGSPALTADQWEGVGNNIRLIAWTLGRLGLTPQERADGYDPGLDALIAAAKKWEPGRAAFSTYATAAIRNRIIQYRDRREGQKTRRFKLDYRLWVRGMQLRGFARWGGPKDDEEWVGLHCESIHCGGM